MPLSVVMAVYNGERFLREAVESVLAQTFREFELVVVDDGSTDSSLSILKEYTQKDRRIVVVEAPHRGVAATRNLALARATHKLVAVVDADDRMLPERLERQLWFLEQNRDVSVACSFAYIIDAHGKRIALSSHPIDTGAGVRSRDPSHFLEIVHSSVMAVKEDVLAVGGYRKMDMPLEDRDLWGRLVTSGFRIRCQRERLVEYRLHGSALSTGAVSRACELIDLNVVRRLDGAPEIPYERFLEWNRSRSLAQRLGSVRRNFALSEFKGATRHYAERRWPQCASALLAAALVRPMWTVSRALSGITAFKDRSLSAAPERPRGDAQGTPDL
jgi:glycosyltransferase involved in cell wall biosynthesis